MGNDNMVSTTPENTTERLPEKILEFIFASCDTETKLKALCVCRRWQKVIRSNPALRPIASSFDTDASKIEMLLKRENNYGTIRCKSVFYETSTSHSTLESTLRKYYPGIKVLNLINFDNSPMPINIDILANSFLRKHSTLVGLSLVNTVLDITLEHILWLFPHLETLLIVTTIFILPPMVEDENEEDETPDGVYIHPIKYMSLNGYPSVKHPQFHLRNLTHLSLQYSDLSIFLHYAPERDSSSYDRISFTLPKLEYLAIDKKTITESELVIAFPIKLPVLKNLVVNYCDFGDPLFVNLKAPMLERLTFLNMLDLPIPPHLAPKKFPNLVALEIEEKKSVHHDKVNIHYSELIKMISSWRGLQVLYIDGIFDITDEFIDQLNTTLPKLNGLCVMESSNISVGALVRLVKLRLSYGETRITGLCMGTGVAKMDELKDGDEDVEFLKSNVPCLHGISDIPEEDNSFFSTIIERGNYYKGHTEHHHRELVEKYD